MRVHTHKFLNLYTIYIFLIAYKSVTPINKYTFVLITNVRLISENIWFPIIWNIGLHTDKLSALKLNDISFVHAIVEWYEYMRINANSKE